MITLIDRQKLDCNNCQFHNYFIVPVGLHQYMAGSMLGTHAGCWQQVCKSYRTSTCPIISLAFSFKHMASALTNAANHRIYIFISKITCLQRVNYAQRGLVWESKFRCERNPSFQSSMCMKLCGFHSNVLPSSFTEYIRLQTQTRFGSRDRTLKYTSLCHVCLHET